MLHRTFILASVASIGYCSLCVAADPPRQIKATDGPFSVDWCTASPLPPTAVKVFSETSKSKGLGWTLIFGKEHPKKVWCFMYDDYGGQVQCVGIDDNCGSGFPEVHRSIRYPSRNNPYTHFSFTNWSHDRLRVMWMWIDGCPEGNRICDLNISGPYPVP